MDKLYFYLTAILLFYNINLFSQNPRVENNALGSIEGATALKLDESYQLDEQQNNSIGEIEDENLSEDLYMNHIDQTQKITDNIPSGVSIESASYIENSNLESEQNSFPLNSEEEHTPKLFSDDQNQLNDESVDISKEEQTESDQLFDQDIDEEEDFEIPAFLRKQKF